MKLKNVVIIFSLSVFSTSSVAKIFIAEVEQLRGHVTQLKPGAKQAEPLFLGDKIEEDTSLVTGEKSFVRVKFLDGSLLNLGPTGKIIVVQMPKEGAGVVSLLKGTLRTQVEKNRNTKAGENKFFVKTRSAAMGVRGTDFQTVYNPENKMTSLLTFKGEVAMANVKEVHKQMAVKTVRVNNQDVEVEQVVSKANENALQQKTLNDALKTKETVVVKPGQFSGTVKQFENVSKPVKISPLQLNALYKNKDLEAKGDNATGLDAKKNMADETKKAILESSVAQADQEAPPEGYFNAKTKEFAPKAGGFIDLTTGLYVPPASDSEYDSQRKIYIPSKVGSVDTKTGEYVAPEGLKLDAKKGFIVDTIKMAELGQSKKIEASKTLLAMSSDLNKTIGRDFVLAPENAKIRFGSSFGTYTPREVYTKNSLSVALTNTSEKLTYSELSDNQYNRKYNSVGGTGFAFAWLLNSDGVFQPLAEFSLKDIEYKQAGIRQPDTRLFAMAVGGRYYVSDRFNYVAKLLLEQNHYFTYTLDSTNSAATTTTPELKVVTVPKIKGGVNYNIYERTRFQIFGDLGMILTGPRESADFSLNMGLGVYGKLSLRTNFTQKFWGELGLGLDHENQKAKDTTSSQSLSRDDSTIAFRLGGVF